MAKTQLTTGQYLKSCLKIGLTIFRIAPGSGIVRLSDAVIQATLPIATTYFAALTTTALTDAYVGRPGASSRVLVYIFITSAIGLVMLSWRSVDNFITVRTRYLIEAAVEDEMMAHFSSLPFALYDDKDVIDMYEKANRFTNYFSYIFETVSGMFVSGIGAIGAVIALATVSPLLGLVVLVAVMPGIAIQLRLARRQSQHWNSNVIVRRRKNSLNNFLLDPRHIAELRVYGLARHLIEMYGALRTKDHKERIDFELRSIWEKLVADVCETAVELGALLWVVVQIIAHTQPIGQFVFVQQMVSRALQSAGSLATQLATIDENLANIVDYQQFMDLADDAPRPQTLATTPDHIVLRDVSFHYPKTTKNVLHHISFDIRRGQHIAIVGENGAGKSTLTKLIMGLYEPTSGSILVDGVRLGDITLESWHAQIGLLAQEFSSYYFATINENVYFGDVSRPLDEDRLYRAIAAAEFGDIVSKFKHRGDTYIERWMAEDSDGASAVELSGGQYQRLALARNFYRDSPIIILDEPTSAIDALAEARIFKHLFSEIDKTIITISHRLTTIEKADIVYMLKDGRLVEQGTAKELIAKKGEFYHMFESQITS